MDQRAIEKAFTRIYEKHKWGGGSRSGPGSDVANNEVYLPLLQNLLGDADKAITSVLDVGCGDWTLAREIDWKSISYTGMDIVPSLIERNTQKYAAENIEFVHGNLVEDALPAADLLIVKDVLQHLSNRSVEAFLPKLKQFKFALITNDVRIFISPRMPFRWFFRYSKANKEISDGGWRPLSLNQSPFRIGAGRLSHYEVRHQKALYEWLFVKEILLWKNEAIEARPPEECG